MKLFKIFKILPSIPRSLSSIDYIVGGILIYSFGTTLFQYYLSQQICWILDAIGLLLFVIGIIKRKANCNLDSITKNLTAALLVYGFLLFLCSCFDTDFNVAHIVTQRNYVLWLLMPIAIFYTPQKREINKIFRWLYIGVFCGLIHLILNIKSFLLNAENLMYEFHYIDERGFYFYLSMITVSGSFIIAISLFYYSNVLKNKWQKVVIFICIILSILSTLSFGRRSSSVLVLAILIMQYFYSSLVKKNNRFIFFIAFAFLLLFVLSNITNIVEYFPILNDRYMDDTRSSVEDDFWHSTTTLSFLFGKGIHGTYISDAAKRGVIETGYLYMILKAGFIYFAVYVFLILYSVMKGLKSSNNLLKACSFYLIYSLISMYPAGLPSFNIINYMIFLSISMCSDRRWRNLKEDIFIYGKA